MPAGPKTGGKMAYNKKSRGGSEAKIAPSAAAACMQTTIGGCALAASIEDKLAELGVRLPLAAAPAANYLPFARSGALVFTAGQLPLKDGKLAVTGLLGRDVDV